MEERWITVVETKAFQERAKSRMSREEMDSAIVMIAREPTCGDIIKNTGGVRKVRFRAMGRGKSKGVRIVYYYYNKSVPVFLLTVFSKSEKSDLTQAEQRTLARLVKILRDSYRSLEG